MDNSESGQNSINLTPSASEDHSLRENDTSTDGTSTLHNLEEFSLTPSPIPELEENTDMSGMSPQNITSDIICDAIRKQQLLCENTEDSGVKSNDQSKRNSVDSTCSTSERIVPIINVRSTIKEKLKTVPSLRRTSSEYDPFKLEKKNASVFGSQEALSTVNQSKSKKSIPTTSTLRRRSIDKSAPLLRTVPPKKPLASSIKKIEKGVGTELKNLSKIEPKVDSIRKQIPKPRSQIVAAVTQRLYAKSKKKEIGINTEDQGPTKNQPKELSICSNARLNLRELTRRAIRAHRIKDEATQTDLFPVLRVKEMSTDVNDLKISAQEVRDAQTVVHHPETKDSAISCVYLDSFSEAPPNDFRNAFVVTRSCSTQVEEELFAKENGKDVKSSSNEQSIPTVSFTKYLREKSQQKPEILETIVSNPIYTNTVNINISHNYMNGRRNEISTPEDSLEGESQQNMNFPTPDLISNHNSLEPHILVSQDSDKQQPIEARIKYPNAEFEAALLQITDELQLDLPNSLLANYISIPDYTTKITSVTIPSVFVPEICIVPNNKDRCLPFPAFKPETAKPKVTEYLDFKCDDCIIITEPLILKSIMKQMHLIQSEGDKHENEDSQSEESDQSFQSGGIPDSLEYHLANAKKVRFSRSKKVRKDRMFSVMSNFLEEAKVLMNNFTTVAERLDKVDRPPSFPEDFDLQISVNDISGLCSHTCDNRRKKRRKPQLRKCEKLAEGTQTEETKIEDEYSQTIPIVLLDNSTQYDCDIPLNKYEALLEDSCRRLEEKINFEPQSPSLVHHLSDPFLDEAVLQNDASIDYNPWDLSMDLNLAKQNDFSSLESNPVTFSDYGSLPRKYPKRHRTSCSPSALLRQLTNMRKQVVETSREELLK